MASDPQRNIDFYTRLLGQRLVKVTVNFDDPGTYHLYYGDEVGSPGTIMTFFPWPHARRGRPGNGEVAAVAYAVPPNTLGQWKARLEGHNLDYAEGERFGSPLLSLRDPDGLTVELIAQGGADVPRPWPNSPVEAGMAPRGFHSVTLWVENVAPVRTLLTEHLGFEALGEESGPEGRRTRFGGDSDGVGLFVDVLERPGQPRGQFGAGSVHHVALRTRNDAEQAEYQRDLSAAGYGVTPVQDRQYFHSIYFRDPSGVLFEIATDAPGFPADERVDELGKVLKLPEWLEGKREAIEGHLPAVVNPEYGSRIGRNDANRAADTGSGDASSRINGPHGEQPLLAAGRSPELARAAVVLLHGRGGSAEDILSLSEAFGMSAFAYVAPQAAGNSWYPQSFLAPPSQNEPGLASALQAIEDALAALEGAGIAREHVILGGFSQGACLALEYAARHARRYGGLFAFSGGLIGPAGTPRDYAGNLAGTPVFLGCSDHDPHIPLERVEQSARVLERLGAKVEKRIYPQLEHGINDDEIAAMRAMLHTLSVESL